MQDLFNKINVRRVLSPASVADNTARVGAIVDRLGCDSVCYVIATGSIGDANAQFIALLEESDAADMAGANAVDDADLHGTEALASFTEADDNRLFKLGYRGSKRYTRLTISPLNNGTAALFAAFVLLGHSVLYPTPNPPA